MRNSFNELIVGHQKKEVKPIRTIIEKDWAIVDGEYFIFTEEEKKWRKKNHVGR